MPYNAQLQTSVERLEYDFNTKIGRVFMPCDCCTDMRGAIKLFKAIDPEVLRIETWAGTDRDAFYSRPSRESEWRAHSV